MYTAATKAKRIAAARKKIAQFRDEALKHAKARDAAVEEQEKWEAQLAWLEAMPVTVDDDDPSAEPLDAP